MGCAQSKESKIKGLFTQQEEFIGNNNKACHGPQNDPPQATTSTMPSTHSPTNPLSSSSRHSPPASRPSSQHIPILEGLGSLSEVWSMPQQLRKFKEYLDTLNEGEDSEGNPLSMMRYATFLELYARLDMEYNSSTHSDRLVQLVDQIAVQEEHFLGRERCLRCIDSGMRREVLNNIKMVKAGSENAGPTVFILIYPRVVEKLEEMLGNYQNMLMEEEQKKKKKEGTR